MLLRLCSSFRASILNPSISRRISILQVLLPMSMSTDSKSPHLPPLSHILETCLYVRDLKASVKFYRDNFLMEPFLESVGTPTDPTRISNYLTPSSLNTSA